MSAGVVVKMKLTSIPEEPTLADIGRLFKRLHDCMEKMERRFERRIKTIEETVTKDRGASEARDGVGGQMIKELLERLEKINTAHETTATTVNEIKAAQASNAENVTAVKTAVVGEGKKPLLIIRRPSWKQVPAWGGGVFGLFALIKIGNALWTPVTSGALGILHALWKLATT